MIAQVFLPKNGSTPFQAVVYFPGGFALLDENFGTSLIEDALDFLLRSGRALIFPIYKSTYERRDQAAILGSGGLLHCHFLPEADPTGSTSNWARSGD